MHNRILRQQYSLAHKRYGVLCGVRVRCVWSRKTAWGSSKL